MNIEIKLKILKVDSILFLRILSRIKKRSFRRYNIFIKILKNSNIIRKRKLLKYYIFKIILFIS